MCLSIFIPNAKTFWKRKVLWYQIIGSCFSFLLRLFLISFVNISMFSHIFQGFSKSCIVNLKKYISKSFFVFYLSSLFISMYGLTLCNVFISNPWFNVCFNFFMHIEFFFYHASWLHTNFLIFIYSSKNGKSFWSSSNISRYWTSTSRKYLMSLSSIWFFMKS